MNKKISSAVSLFVHIELNTLNNKNHFYSTTLKQTTKTVQQKALTF